MNNEPDLLREHAIIDNRIRLIRANVQSARLAVTEQLALLKSKNDIRTATCTKKRQNEEHKKALARDIARYTSQQKAGERIVESGSENAETALLQIEKCQNLIDTAETEMLLLLEEEQSIDEQIQTTDLEITAIKATLHDAKVDAKNAIQLGKQQFSLASAERTQVREALASHLIERYDTLFARRGTAVAYLQGKTCSSCNSDANGSCIAEINRGRLAACRRCGRWLVKETE